METKSNYNKELKYLAREKRSNSTLGEILLWKNLLSKSRLGFQFNRQFPFENYILDFICRKLKFVIEVDGSSHNFKLEEDNLRDMKLHNLGYEVLRISEHDVRHNFENVSRAVVSKVEELKLKYLKK
jgi:very-short-patch-repair endonuclease